MSQKEFLEPIKLLNEDGTLNDYGWCRHNFFEYERRFAKPRSRVKEWDFYSFTDGKYYVVISFFNITLASSPAIAVFDLESRKKVFFKTTINLFTKTKDILPRISDVPNFFRYSKDGITVQFDTRRNCKKIEFSTKGAKKCEANFTIYVDKEHEGITTVTPFDKPNQFFLANKQFAMKAEGSLTINGKTIHDFNIDDTYAIMDWGRGVWPHNATWYWGCGAQKIDGKTFGFDFTWAINKDTPDLETCLFYDGKIHKIGEIKLDKEAKENGFMNEWHFKSVDGRFEATMKPVFDNSSKMILGIAGQNCDQVFGIFDGYGILDDGKKIEFNNLMAFCEYVESKW